MDATTTALLITTLAALCGNIVKSHYDERTRRLNREQDRLDMEARSKLTAEHREMMAQKMDENTAVSVVAAAKADDAYREANEVNQKIAQIGTQIEKNTDPKSKK
jgi:hypothetical protein